MKLELAREDGRVIHAQVSRELYGALSATAGERLYVRPRNVRVFVEPEAAKIRPPC